MPTDVIAAGQYKMVDLPVNDTYLTNQIDFDSSRGYGDSWDESGFIWDVRYESSFRAFSSTGLRVAGSQPVGKEECLLPVPELGGRVSGEEMPPGTWFCALTDSGNFSAVRVDALDPGGGAFPYSHLYDV